MSDTAATADWRRRHALGLPAGSVRALLALGVVGTVCGLLVRAPDEAPPEALESLLFVVLGHYFAARAQAPADASAGPPPLWLPRGSVRLLLIAGLVGVGVIVMRQEGAASQRGVVTLVLAFAFVLGLLLTRVTGWLQRRIGGTSRVLEDMRAIVGIAAVGALALHAFFHVLPDAATVGVGRLGLEQGLAALVGFYFGSRS
ncbi:hypothetical protein [Nannocystis bainbridge]|uniref:Uncharacterized protein n=1 Tax=Nannocystis bainbridge TaxID=2995303 RepID=A0ABT5DQ15_9BACT|nr:hypothetical protein [Nannocystis bainbridge]MDC0715751.1 hypothetical protein [Nannocystis bainbridge]